MIRQLEEGDREEELGLDSQGRLVISIFYGDNTEWWISRAEKIFSKNQLLEAEKIEVAISCFNWETWKWFQEIDQLRPVRTWDELKGLMLTQFCMNELSSDEELRRESAGVWYTRRHRLLNNGVNWRRLHRHCWRRRRGRRGDWSL